MKYGRNSRRRQLITFNISLRILVVSNEKAGFKWFRYFHSIVSASDVDIFPTFLPNIYFAIDILFFPLFLWMHVCACLKRLVVDIIHVESTRADYENQIFWIEFIFLPLSLSLSLSHTYFILFYRSFLILQVLMQFVLRLSALLAREFDSRMTLIIYA